MNQPPEFHIAPLRVLTLPEISYFYVTNTPTEFANLDRDLNLLLDELEEARQQAHLSGVRGIDITRYWKAEDSERFWMEVGTVVNEGTPSTGKAQVKTLPPYPCAAVLLWGGLIAHIGETYEMLNRSIQQAGLEPTGECREWTYWFESVDSPNNLMGLFMGIR